jgi:hypothetical protein
MSEIEQLTGGILSVRQEQLYGSRSALELTGPELIACPAIPYGISLHQPAVPADKWFHCGRFPSEVWMLSRVERGILRRHS